MYTTKASFSPNVHIYKLTTCETLEGANIAQNKLFALKIPSGVCGLLIRG